MTDHTDLVRRLEKSAEARAPVDMHKEPLFSEAAAAIRALAGEVERLKAMPGRGPKRLTAWSILNDERDTLRAAVAELRLQAISDVGQLQTALEERDAARAEVAALRKLLQRISEWDQMNPPMTGDHAHWKREIDAALADKPRFTDGRGNSLDHLVDEKP